MTEFQKQIPKKGFQEAVAKYMGLTEEPLTKDGAEWKKYKTKWHIKDKQTENKFTLWTPIKSGRSQIKTEDELKQFSWYKIVWVESAESFEGQEWVDKKIVIINPHTVPEKPIEAQPEEIVTETVQTTPEQKSPENEAVTPFNDYLDSFSDLYRDKVKEEEMSYGDFLSRLIRYLIIKKKVGTLSVDNNMLDIIRKRFNEFYDDDMGKLIK